MTEVPTDAAEQAAFWLRNARDEGIASDVNQMIAIGNAYAALAQVEQLKRIANVLERQNVPQSSTDD
jgi:hypothetical protein